MPNLRPFQIIILGVFAALAVGGLILFSLFRGFGSDPNPYGMRVVIWGTLDRSAFAKVIEEIARTDDNYQVVSYVEKDSRTFRDELVNAIAEGRGPDAIVLPHDLLISERAKLYAIPYDTLSVRDIRDTYVDGAEIFSLSDGTYGFPFAADPLVMYWNRDLFATAGFAAPPRTWEEITATTIESFVRSEQSPQFTLTQEALAFGEYQNVQNAKSILLMLLIQAGSELVYEGNRNNYVVALDTAAAQTVRRPLDASLDFYTQFANPARTTYTWNRSLPQDRNEFLAGDLALYFGFGSEYAGLVAGNPNLNFDAAPVPQGSGVTVQKNYGRFYSLVPLRSSSNLAGTYRALGQMGSASRAHILAEGLGMAPVHRSTLAAGHSDPVRQTMYTMALIARGFLDPSPSATAQILETMVEDVTSGRARVSEAAADAIGRFNQLVR